MGSESEPILLTGTHQEQQVLVTIWPDGACEIATRPDSQATWGPPSPLEEAR